MAKKQGRSKPKAQSALAPIAEALVQGYLGPKQRVINMERFFTALMQALHDAYALGWKDRGEIERAKCLTASLAQPISMRRGFARSALGNTKVITPSRNSAEILSWSMIPEI